MARMKTFLQAGAFVIASSCLSTAQAAPLVPAPAEAIGAGHATTTIGLGCGGGYTRDWAGRCRPLPGYYGPPRLGPPGGYYARPRYYGGAPRYGYYGQRRWGY